MSTKEIGIEKILLIIGVLGSMSTDYAAVKAVWGNWFGMLMAAFPVLGKLAQIGKAIPEVVIEASDLDGKEIGKISEAFFAALTQWKNALGGTIPMITK